MADDEVPAEEEAPKKKGGKLLLILGLLVGLGGGGAAGAIFLGPMIGQRLAAGASEGGEDPVDGHEEEGGGGGGEGGEVAGVVHLIDNLVVNPAGSNGTRFLLASVAFETSDASLDEPITARDLEIRDGLIRILGMKSVGQLTDYAFREQLVAELHGAIEGVIGEGTVLRIYLPQYVIQ